MVRQDAPWRPIASAVRRHLVFVLVLTVLGLGLGAAYAHFSRTKYTASATLLPKPITGNPLSPDIALSNGTQLTVAMLTEAGLVDTPAVSALASKRLGRTVPAKGESITATVPPNTQIIKITYVSTTPRGAKQGAQAVAQAFLQYRRNVAAEARSSALARLRQQADVTSSALNKAIQAEKAAGPNSVSAQLVQLYSNRLANLNNEIGSTKALNTNPGSVVTAATLPAKPSGIPPVAAVVIGALVGLVLGLVGAAWLGRRTGVVDSEIELEIGGVPIFARLPRQRPGMPGLITKRSSDDALQEAYRHMRAGVVASVGSMRVLGISCISAVNAPAHSNESSAAIVANLGIALAHSGFRVSVVAADPLDASLEGLLDAPSAPGLSEIVAGDAKVDGCLQMVHGVELLPGGSNPGASRELYAGPRFGRVVARLRQRSEYVLVAAAPTSSSDADAAALACECMLVAVTDGVTTHADAKNAVDRFARLGVDTIGAVSLPGGGGRPVRATPTPTGSPARTPGPKRPYPAAPVAVTHPLPDAGADA